MQRHDNDIGVKMSRDIIIRCIEYELLKTWKLNILHYLISTPRLYLSNWLNILFVYSFKVETLALAHISISLCFTPFNCF